MFYSKKEIQRLMDLPYAGQAKQELLIAGRWDESDMKASYVEPVSITIEYQSGYTVSECGDKLIHITAH